MIGRPRRRHAVDKSGRLYEVASNQSQPPRSAPRVIDQRKGRSQLLNKALRAVIISLSAAIGLIIVWALVGSYITYRKVTDVNSTKKAPILNFLGDIKPNQLQGEGDGRINVLMIGVGGPNHPGGTLADTIIVASFDPKNKEVALLSIPRDLYVPIHGDGYGKINSAHSYGEKQAKQTGGGPAVLKKTVSDILDMPIHYYVRVDFTALEKIVDTLGGVTVNVEKPIVDLSYPADNMIDYAPFRLAAGVQTLNGKTALKYVRSRHAAGGEGSDFARAKRQQKLLTAIKDKALTVGVLANPKKVVDIINILGNHIKTDLTGWELERFVQMWKDIDNSKVISKVLDDGPDGPLVSQSGDSRGYILLPKTGDFSEVQEIAHSIFTDPYLRQENATISFINASGSVTTGRQAVRLLQSRGYQVTDETPKNQIKQAKTELIDHNGTKPYTKQFLQDRFKVQAVLRQDKTATDDLVLILGTDYHPTVLQSTGKNLTPTSPSPKLIKGAVSSPSPSPSNATSR